MLKREITITPQHILELSSLQGIIHFFAELGYNTTIDSTPEKDAATQHEIHRHDDLSNKIARFRRIAQNNDETNTTLYVYLYVLKSITAKVREDVVRDLLKRHSGEYLLILTGDTTPFKELEFVYIDHVSHAEQRQVVLQPTLFDDSPPAPVGPPQIRTLSVDRRHPDYKAIRFFGGLRYTHRYVLDQCKTISSAYDRAETSEEFFHNRSLFSDHYLKKRLPEEVTEWLQTDQAGPGSEALTEASAILRRLYAGASRTFSGKSREELCQLLFEPVLDLLGFTWKTIQKTNKRATQDEKRQPDYTLAMKHAAATPLAVCLTYPWERSLDDYLENDGDDGLSSDPMVTNENPSAVVVSLLEQEQTNWAILTNGRFWRLYSSKARSRATNYYEIDLLEALTIRRELTEDALKALRYFWLFFRADAFAPLPRADYETPPYICFLDYILRESERYARELGASLKERIFDDIFPYFARGFVHYAQHKGHLPQNLGEKTPEERASLLQPFFEGTLAFLYRLLFLLYAESRALLPVHDVRYHAQSLTRMKEEIAVIAKNNKPQARTNIEERFPENVTATDLYDRLRALFRAIDKGDDELNVPTYNGGLFMTEVDAGKAEEELIPDEKAARFLATYRIPNRDLALGLDLMARDEDERKGKGTKREFELVYVDYKSLGVRQLGSIYEGLLEFKLRIAVERMVVLKGKVLSLQEAIATGQYKPGKTKAIIYEPDTVNNVYIENDRHERKTTGSYYTPDYIVKYIIEQTVGPLLQERFEKLRPRFREYQRAMQNRVKRNEQLRKQKIPSGKDLQGTYTTYEGLAEEFFDLKVLDPAMGSGHFLVDTVDYITDKMTEFLRPLTPNPVHQKLQQIRSNIVAEVESQNVSIDRARLNELNLLKRQVLKRCIFGVDVNYMAVTLTKVSLWLDTFTQGAPLSFLDYHLKWGNSLIGTTLSKIEKESEGFWFAHDLSQVLSSADLARRLSLGTDATPQEIAEAHQVYAELLTQLKPYKTLFNVWVNQYFGDKWARTTVETCFEQILAQKIDGMMPRNQEAYLSAQKLAAPQHKNFFHWELEFPEVFFRNNRRLSEGEAGFDAVIGNPPYRVLIKSQVGDDLIKYYNSSYDAAQYNPNLFALMVEKAIVVSRSHALISLIIPSLWFTNAYFSNLRRVITRSAQLLLLADLGFGVFEEVVETSIFLAKKDIEMQAYNLMLAKRDIEEQIGNLNVRISSTEVAKNVETGFFFFSHKKSIEAMLKDTVDPLGKSFVVYRGVETRDNATYLAKEKLSSNYMPILMGTDVERYICDWTDTFVKFIPKELKSNADISMYEVPEKILIRRTGSQLIASLDTQQFLAIKNLYVIIPKTNLNAKYLLALLNSNLLNKYNQSVLDNAGDAFAQLKKTDIEKFPIRCINFTTLRESRLHCLDEIQRLYMQFICDSDNRLLLDLAHHHLTLQPEASDVVHDLLAYLAERMLDLNKEKHALQSAFLIHLETKLEIQPQPDKTSGKLGLEALKGKDRLLNYPRDYRKNEKALSFQEIQNILLENRRRFRLYPDSRLMREIEDEYGRNVEAIEPIKQQLKLTDNLIDSVVYKLYGLTEDEVRVVEGKD